MGDLGEWGFLKNLLPTLSKTLSKRVDLGPGDDAALVRFGRDVLAITTDMLVDGVHFRQEWSSGEDLGHKTLAVNLSDLAAMGDVEPTAGVLSAGIPPETPVGTLQGLYRGFARLSRRHGFDLVGGDTVRSDRLTLSLTALGRVRGQIFKRSGARVGDALMVTGTLGDAVAGLAILEKGSRGYPGSPFSPPSAVASHASVGMGAELGKDGGRHGLSRFVGWVLAERFDSWRGLRGGRGGVGRPTAVVSRASTVGGRSGGRPRFGRRRGLRTDFYGAACFGSPNRIDGFRPRGGISCPCSTGFDGVP
ncbi:MAG: thiamine-monophosphate kinase [Elusimicrobia bacterium]|nr:thiamine-monophosphate kinase [Elusimicrobiota bacterium]